MVRAAAGGCCPMWKCWRTMEVEGQTFVLPYDLVNTWQQFFWVFFLLKKGNWGRCSVPDSRGSYRNEEVWSVNCVFTKLAECINHKNGWAVDLCQVQGTKHWTFSQAYVQCSATLKHHPSMGTSPWSWNTFVEVTETKPVRFLGVICSPSHCSLTVALVEDTTVATVKYLEPKTAPAVPHRDGCVGHLSCWGSWACCFIPASFLLPTWDSPIGWSSV